MAEYADVVAESIRQSDLTWSLGQVPCLGGHEDWWIPDTGCPWCGAQV